jgi:hypothetical protein
MAPAGGVASIPLEADASSGGAVTLRKVMTRAPTTQLSMSVAHTGRLEFSYITSGSFELLHRSQKADYLSRAEAIAEQTNAALSVGWPFVGGSVIPLLR